MSMGKDHRSTSAACAIILCEYACNRSLLASTIKLIPPICSEGITGTDDYSPLLAVAGFAAVSFNKLSVDRVKLLQALAVLQLFVSAVNLVTNRGVGDKVGFYPASPPPGRTHDVPSRLAASNTYLGCEVQTIVQL